MFLACQDINLIPCCCRPWTSLYTPQPHCGLLGLVFTTSPLRGIIIHFIYAQLEKDFPFHEIFFITCTTKLETITLRSLKFAGQKIWWQSLGNNNGHNILQFLQIHVLLYRYFCSNTSMAFKIALVFSYIKNCILHIFMHL